MYAPIPTFFLHGSEDLDINTLQRHAVRLAKAGIRPLLAGSMGEAPHLSHSERIEIIKAVRSALDNEGLIRVPIIAGTGGGSTRETIELSKAAAAAGADYAIVIAPGYFSGVLASDRKALKAFWVEVAENSPIPVIIYNYPGASGGIDLDSDFIVDLAKSCPNTAGVKLTCGNVGKLTRICSEVSTPSFSSLYPRKNPAAPFLVLGGFTDFVVPSAFVRAHGAITGLANFAPFCEIKLYQLAEAAKKDPSVLDEANRIQGIVANADFVIAKTSIAGIKWLLQKVYGYGGLPRKPLPPMNFEATTALWAHPHVQELAKLEQILSKG
jgi:L-threo-3-deoxy-hexylosonate aldolase